MTSHNMTSHNMTSHNMTSHNTLSTFSLHRGLSHSHSTLDLAGELTSPLTSLATFRSSFADRRFLSRSQISHHLSLAHFTTLHGLGLASPQPTFDCHSCHAGSSRSFHAGSSRSFHAGSSRSCHVGSSRSHATPARHAPPPPRIPSAHLIAKSTVPPPPPPTMHNLDGALTGQVNSRLHVDYSITTSTPSPPRLHHHLDSIHDPSSPLSTFDRGARQCWSLDHFCDTTGWLRAGLHHSFMEALSRKQCGRTERLSTWPTACLLNFEFV
jgi:hypothetical protein